MAAPKAVNPIPFTNGVVVTQGQAVVQSASQAAGYHVCLRTHGMKTTAPAPGASNDDWHWVATQ